ncbi:MAG TPA: TIR domain-containing protein [Sphingomicrobium sp.]|jgi:adenylate cyclase|nr:TIR domain-containing protein [Sphingomicrobium sp.]
MADVFLSYARADELEATRVADGLRSGGYEVWRDDELPAHRAYGEVIEERLNSAKAVVVLWSIDAAKSQWVRAEADTARTAGTLVQASLDGHIPPLPFNQIQCAELGAWEGDPDAPGWRKLLGSVRALAGSPPSANQTRGRARRHLCICVLPFQNMSGDSEQEYFSDGISEDITTDLSRISALGVVARNTAFTFKGHSVDVTEVARKLGVSHVLEGSVRKAGGRVRINAQLIDGATGEHLWADRYDRDLEDIFAIQDEISKAIVDALKVRLLPEEKKALERRGTMSAEAYNFYLLARQYWITGNHGDPGREERVMRISSKAVEIDPYYADAWALLAIAQSNLRYGFGYEVDDGVAAAHTALAIDPTIAEAHCAMARRLEVKGRDEEALAELKKGLELNPESWELNKAIGNFLIWRGKIEEAAAHFEKATSLMDSDFHAWGMLTTCYFGVGDDESARDTAKMTLKQVEQVLAHDPSNGAAISFGVSALAALGEQDRAREWMERALLIDPDNLNMRYNFACALARGFGDSEAAIRMLDSSLSRIKGSIGAAEFDPDLGSIREDPRFKKIIQDAKDRLGIGGCSASPGPAETTRIV